MKRVLSILCACALMLSMAACAGTPSEPTATEAPAETKTETATEAPKTEATEAPAEQTAENPISKEPITCEFFLSAGSYLWTGDELVWQAIKDATNITFKPIPVPLADYEAKVTTLLASGSLPDIIHLRQPKFVDPYGPQGAFVNLTEAVDAGKMPNFKAMMDKYPDSYKIMRSPDGNVYGTARIYDMPFRIDETYLVRHDIMKANNLAYPKSFEELYELLKKFKEINPESIPYTSRWGFENLIGAQTTHRNTSYTFFLNHDTNKYEWGPEQAAYKESLQFFANAYKDGLLNKEFATLTDEQWNEDLATGKSVITYDYPQGLDELAATNAAQMQEGWDMYTMIQPEYNGKLYGTTVLSGYYGSYHCISNTSKYKEELIRFLDWTYSKEGIDTLLFGVEGDTYTRDANGKVVMAPDVAYSGNPTGARKNLGLNVQDIFNVLNDEGADVYEKAAPRTGKSYQALLDNKAYGPPFYSLKFADVKDNERYTELRNPINTYITENSMKVVIGELSIDKWETEIVPKAKEMGVEEALTLANKAHEAMFK